MAEVIKQNDELKANLEENSEENLERNIQKRFFDNLLNQKEGFDNSPINVYQKLVLMRYIEVIKNSFPLFVDIFSFPRIC